MPTTEPKDIHLERIPTSDTRHPEKLQPRLENLKTSAEGTLAHITDFKNQITTMIAEMSSVRSELGSSTSDLEVANTIDIRLKNLQTQIEYYERKSEALKKKIEWEKTKADCLKAVSDGIEEIKRVLAVTPATSPDHARMQWVIQAVENAKTKAETNNTLQQDVIEPHSGQQQKEGIPVDELIEVLRGVANTEHISAAEKTNLQTIANTLENNSDGYFNVHPEMTVGGQQHWRTRYEAELISRDYRATGSPDHDYQRAMNVMKNRRELVIDPEPVTFIEIEPVLLSTPLSKATETEPVVPSMPLSEPEATEAESVVPSMPLPEVEDTPVKSAKLTQAQEVSYGSSANIPKRPVSSGYERGIDNIYGAPKNLDVHPVEIKTEPKVDSVDGEISFDLEPPIDKINNDGWRESNYADFFSQTIKENPQADLSEPREIKDYFDRQDPRYKEYIEKMAMTIPEIEDNCRVSVCVPAYKEGQRIYESLTAYIGQKKKNGNKNELLSPDSFEILILDNHPQHVAKDNTEEEILRFQNDHPEIRVRYIHAVFPKRRPIGYYRKIINDVALARMQSGNKKTDKKQDHILVSHDADFYGLSDSYFDEIITAFDQDKKLDAFGGMSDFNKEGYDKLPITWAARRLLQFYDLIQQTKAQNKRPNLIGINSGFRASTYAAVGGYNPNCKVAEDIEMGILLQDARGWDASRAKFIRKAVVTADPRRGIVTMKTGKKLIQQYDDWAENEEIRNKTWQQILEEGTEWAGLDVKVFEKEAQAIFDVKNKRSSSEADTALIRTILLKALKVMGVEAEFTGEKNNTILIKDAARLVEGFNEFKARGANNMGDMRVLPKNTKKRV